MLLDRKPDNDRRGAMVNGTLGTQTPVDVIALGRVVHRPVALVGITHAVTATGLAATVVIGDNVVFAICRIVTCTNPGDR